ncbi:hypothetical protein BGZ92_001729, partial [Podila epicladia]
MDSQVQTHGAIPNDPQHPLDLANLTSTERLGSQHTDNAVDYTNEKIAMIPTADRDQQPQLQPGLDQQQQSRRQDMDPEKHMDAPLSGKTTTGSTGGGIGRKFKMAGLVDRVRLAQLEEQHDSPQGEKHKRLSLFPSREKNTQDPEKHQESIKDSRPPPEISYEGELRPSIIHNSIEDDNTGQHRSPGSPGSHHHTDGEHAKAHHHHHHHHHFPKIFSKDGVRNALFLNSAATAFTKPSRARTMDQVDVHLNSLAVTGSAVPALWLRRDDKGRRPPPVLFQLLK